MTIHDLLMAFGVVVVVGIIVKGFWSANRVKAIKQPDDWQKIQGATDTDRTWELSRQRSRRTSQRR